tara:strand:+ start:6748 stop:7896 length:1149 start_codon:yes stop_codon:yes gene_type:complete
MSDQKILYVFDASDWSSRMAVAYGAREQGLDMVIGLINGDDAAAARAPEFQCAVLQKQGGNTSIVGALAMVRDLRRLIRAQDPDTIHAVTLKHGFLTALAAFPFKEKRKIFTMAGLGYLFRSDETQSVILRTLLYPLLWLVFRRANTTLIFQNADDLALFVQKGIVKREHALLIKGSGVHLDQFKAMNVEHETDIPIVLMPTRLVHEKGVAIFIEAARLLKQRGVVATFQIAGGETDNPKAISRDEMIEMTKDGAVEWLGRVDDMPDRLAGAALIVYPSYYGEGIPRVLLEACAAGRAIVTTDHAGCREAVDHNENGLLVPVKNAKATAKAIETILSNPALRRSMGYRSRQKAEQEFDIHSIVAQTVRVYVPHEREGDVDAG